MAMLDQHILSMQKTRLDAMLHALRLPEPAMARRFELQAVAATHKRTRGLVSDTWSTLFTWPVCAPSRSELSVFFVAVYAQKT